MPEVGAGVCGVLLAAGAGRRAGGPKALRCEPDGTSWLLRSVGVLRSGGCGEVVVVLGCAADGARPLLSEHVPPLRTVVAPDWAVGISRSLLAGLTAAQDTPAVALLVHLVDLPDVSAAVVRRVLATAGSNREVLARAAFAGRPGHPVLIGTAHLPRLLAELAERPAAQSDRGARGYLTRHGAVLVECGDLASGDDRDGG